MPDDTAKSRGGWFPVPRSLIERIPEVGSTAFSVFTVILYHVDHDGNAWPAVERLMELAGLSKGCVLAAIRRLESAGWIRTSKRSTSRGLGNLYSVQILDLMEAIRFNFCTSNGSNFELQKVQILDRNNKYRNTTNEEHAHAHADGTFENDSERRIDWLITLWNAMAERVDLPKCKRSTAKRQAAFRSRASEPHWLDEVEASLARIEKSSFCRGGGPNGWRASFDWLLQPDSVTQILEGKYDDWQSANKPGTRGNLAAELRAKLEKKREQHARMENKQNE